MHVWKAIEVPLRRAEFVTLVVRNVFRGTRDGDFQTTFQLDQRVDEELFVPPNDGKITVSDVTSRSAHLAWTGTGAPTDSYQVLYHIGEKDGSMEYGAIMGTYCGLERLKLKYGEAAHTSTGELSHVPDHAHDEPDHSHSDGESHKRKRASSDDDHAADGHTHETYAHDDHKIHSLFAFQKAIRTAHMQNLRPDTYYHVDVVLQRETKWHPIHRTYHSVVIHTPPEASAGASPLTTGCTTMALSLVMMFVM